MRRLACLDIPALPLQLMLVSRPAWRALPAAVVDEDRPQGTLSHVNLAARRLGVLPGQRYATALGLCRELRAGVMLPAHVGDAVARLGETLRGFTPELEAAPDEPGVFWLDAAGLVGLFPSLERWGEEVLGALAQVGLRAALVVAFSRFGGYALARDLGARLEPSEAPGGDGAARDRPRVLASPEDERRLVARVALNHLQLKLSVRERLQRLGVRTVGELGALPWTGLMRRFGPEVARLHRLIHGEDATPFTGEAAPLRFLAREDLDHPEGDATRLLFHLKAMLDAQLPALRAADREVAGLIVGLGPEPRAPTAPVTFEPHALRPAAPTLEAPLLLELVRLRLEHLDTKGGLRAGVVALTLELLPTPAAHAQGQLFRASPHQDTALAATALARVRAELGEEAVGRFTLREAHLPRASFAFQPLEHAPLPAPAASVPELEDCADAHFTAHNDDGRSTHVSGKNRAMSVVSSPSPEVEGALVRALLPEPRPLPRGALPALTDPHALPQPVSPPFVRLFAPAELSGGWWRREVARVYAWAETVDGAFLWVYWDAARVAWFEEGRLA
jgi:protein ImuB